MNSENPHSPIEKFGINEQEVLFQALLYSVRAGLPNLFDSSDPGHPLYTSEYNEQTKCQLPFAGRNLEGSPLFSALKKLSLNIKNYGGQDFVWYRKIETWKDFQNLIRERTM